MAFVLDCSVTMAWIFHDEATEAMDRLREALLDTPAFVPALWPIETANAHALSVYDAMYLELAVRMQMPLATLDRALLGAAQSAGVDGLAID